MIFRNYEIQHRLFLELWYAISCFLFYQYHNVNVNLKFVSHRSRFVVASRIQWKLKARGSKIFSLSCRPIYKIELCSKKTTFNSMLKIFFL